MKKTEYNVMAIMFYGCGPGLRLLIDCWLKTEEQHFNYINKTCIQVMCCFGKDLRMGVQIAKG